jgi:methylthioribulose-1-phosphate dehydratase
MALPRSLFMFSGTDLKCAEELLAAIQFFNQKGWSPATSTNYSVRAQDQKNYIISRSGVDKSNFKLTDFILINSQGKILPPYESANTKSSAETQIHTDLYKRFPEINCVLHTHSVLGTVLSQMHVQQKKIVFSDFEILKGLDGNLTHEMEETLPIVPNSQSMQDILKDMEAHFFPGLHGFLIAGHGLYTWGKDIATAKRHIETFEFLFECYFMMRRL